MIDAQAANPYDLVPYPDLCFAQTHPDRLSTIAMLLGMTPAPVESCRVLELGCASGGNLIPMAYGLPKAEFVGIDLSVKQIEAGQAAVDALGLKNITLRHMDILDITAALGQFDYIIAHGIYSWVPPHVRDRLLAVCKQNLRPEGIAYVSYNTFPGWRMLGIARDMMRYRTRDIQDPQTRLSEARSILRFVTESTSSSVEHPYTLFLQSYGALLEKQSEYMESKIDMALIHDELEEVNDAVYFHEFMDHAERHGLQYVAEAEFPLVMPNNLPKPVMEHLFEMARTTIEMEQYMDFLRNQAFRQTLLCHEEADVDRRLKLDPIHKFYIASRARPQSETQDIEGSTVERFSTWNGATFATDNPVTKAALAYLSEISPQYVSFEGLLETARTRVHSTVNVGRDAQMVASTLLQAFCYNMHLVELHSYLPPAVSTVSEYPVASALARYQLRHGDKVTNLRHENTKLEDISRYVIPLLDGQHDHTALLDELMSLAFRGTLGLQEDDQPVHDEQRMRELLGVELDATLRWLARTGFLVS